MGILDFLGGLGQAGAAPAMTRLTSGLGSQGGMLQHLGMGRYGSPQKQGPMQPGMGWQMGQGGNVTDFLHNLGSQMSGVPMDQPPQQQWGSQQQQPGLAALVQQWMQQNQRQ